MSTQQLKISYTAYIKNKTRKSARYYCRVRQDGKVKDIDLNTTNKAVAEAWVDVRKSELEQYNKYVLIGEEVPADLAAKIVRVSTGSSTSDHTVKSTHKSLKLLAEDYEVDMRRRGLREKSIRSYLKSLRLTLPENVYVEDITAKSVIKWLSVHDHCLSATRRLYSVALREFVKYLSRDYGQLTDLVLNWPVMVKAQSAERGYWTLPEMARIIKAVQCRDDDITEQFQTYCWVMATIGSRQGETGDLQWRDYRDGALTFRAETTKTNTTRTCPVDQHIIYMLSKLQRKSKCSPNDLIFDKIPKSQPARYQLIKYAVTRAKAQHGGLHTFRHSASMYLYSHCHDIKAVSQLLGHSEATALHYYQKSRQADDLRSLVDSAYENQTHIPSIIDDMIQDGLI